MELVCPAGTLPALKAAVDNGADWVYIGFRDETNARNFAGLNFDPAAAHQGIAYAHARGARVLVAINTYPQPAHWTRWTAAVDQAAALEADAVILADLGLLRYAAATHPQLALHLSVQSSATSYEAINLYRKLFGIRRAVLPRVLSLAQVAHVVAHTDVPIEVFGFGGLCVMLEGRCFLSSFVTGQSPNTAGVCSPARSVRWAPRGDGMDTRVGPVLVNRFGPGEKAGYPTLCKGRYEVARQVYYPFEEPVSLNTLELLPQLLAMGVRAIKLEGRQRSPAYVERITRVWRAAIDTCRRDPTAYTVRPEWVHALAAVSEGQQCTLGAYHRPWK